MKSNLFIKFYLAILFLISLILISYGIVNIKDQKNSNIKIMEAQAVIIAKTLVLANVEAILSGDIALIIENSLEFFKENEGVNYLIFNKKDKDKIIVHNNKWTLQKKIDKKYQYLEKKDDKFLIFKGKLYDDEVFHYTYPIKISSFDWGWVHIGFSLDKYNKNLEQIYKNFIYMTLISFLISVIFTYIFTKWMLRPIIKLNNITKDIVNGEYKEVPDIKRTDEISELAHNFNLMVRHLQMSEKQVLKSKSVLERKVSDRTKELHDLNRSLDKKVHEEVQKRQSQEKFLYSQSKMAQMGEMLNNIAHQWRQPLSVITTVTSGIKLKKELNILEDDEFDNSYKLVMENANYLTKTIDTFSKYIQEEHSIENIELKDAINDIIILNSDILKKNFIRINLDLPEYKTSIETVPNFLSQVIFNILINANNALLNSNIINEKLINIKLYKNKKNYYIEIEDNAGGINEEIIDKIFEPYFSTKFNSTGVGMGLYLSYDIVVNQLNGQLNVKNGKNGAFFTIKLPSSINNF